MARFNELGQEIGFALPDWQPRPRPSREPMKGRYCRLEPLEREAHCADLFEAFGADREGRIWTYLPYGPFAEENALGRWIDSVAAADDPLFFAIREQGSGRALGVASFLRISPETGCIEVGHINYSPDLQRTPAATEAMHLMMRRVFAELGYRRYEWKCDALNAASRRAAERLGFTYEGTFRQATLYKGRNRDTAWFSITDKEWPAIAEGMEAWLSPGNFDEGGQQRQSLAALISRVR
jgi:RimJ/RimL family protein N-acetyltransferase